MRVITRVNLIDDCGCIMDISYDYDEVTQNTYERLYRMVRKCHQHNLLEDAEAARTALTAVREKNLSPEDFEIVKETSEIHQE